ncbi:aldose epimerase family protein [Sphingobium boeckii]|uniref:aldose epimerase family protein n=1 Tax=Sphingobium boeckii TaxID=1082345 RepID=UPI001C85CCA0
MNWMRFAGALACLTFSHVAIAGDISRHTFGQTETGRIVESVKLSNDNGVSATIITYGAALQSLILPDVSGAHVDVALGHATLAEYVAKRQFMGASVGRVANRIAGGRFSLDGKPYQVTLNDGPNALHGGVTGVDQAVWDVVEAKADRDSAQVTLRLVSPDGDQGFPGRVTTTVIYRLDDKDQLSIEYQATTDKVTVVSLSNHAYWNLAGEGSASGAMGLTLEIPAASYLPVDQTLIPTGLFTAVEGTAFDFRTPRAIGERVRTASDEQIRIGRGYDHNWVVERTPSGTMHLMARVTDPQSGRAMELWSDQPGLQFYSGNFLDGTSRGKSGQLYRQGDAIVLEPQAFPDAVNQPAFGSVRLVPGKTYRNAMIYKFKSSR